MLSLATRFVMHQARCYRPIIHRGEDVIGT